MGRYTGTSGADTITPTTVPAGVVADPLGSKPSVGADQIYGLEGADHLDGGAGGDTISGGAGNDTIADNYLYNGGEKGPNAGNLIHGNAGNDDISIDLVDTGGANPVTNTAWGDGGNDTIEFNYYVNSQLGDGESWVGQDPAGTITLHGGAGDDTLGNRFSNTFYGQYLIYLDGTTGVFYGEAGNDTMYASSTDPDGDGSFYPGNNPDFLHGGPGNDTYWVFETKDVAIEKAGEGIDTVYANGTDYTLGPNIENLVMTYNEYGGPTGTHGTGNDLDNVISGIWRLL